MYHGRARWESAAFACVLAIGAVGCARPGGAGSPAAAPRPAPSRVSPADAAPVSLDEVPLFFVSGESITWDVTFLGVRGGRARFAVGVPGGIDGKRLLGVVAEAESAGVLAAVRKARDASRSWIDLDTGVPTRTESELELKGRHIQVQAVRRDGEPVADLRVWKDGGPERRLLLRLPSPKTQDPLSAILLMRGWRAPVGSRAVFHTLGGTRLWKTEIVVEGREAVDVPLGRHEAIRLSGISTKLTRALSPEPRARPRAFTVWFSDDDKRIPLRVVARTEYGDIEIAATSYAPTLLGRR